MTPAFFLLTSTPRFAQTFTPSMYIYVRVCVCVTMKKSARRMASTTSNTGECVCVCVCACVCVCVSFHWLLSHVETSHFITQLLYTLVSFGGTFFLDNMFTIYNLSCLCMLTANGIFFFFLTRCVYILLWRCNTSLTGLVFTRRLFLELLIFFHISSFIDSAKDSTHFPLSASTISLPVCTTVLYVYIKF